jgi:hypothetical protein
MKRVGKRAVGSVVGTLLLGAVWVGVVGWGGGVGGAWGQATAPAGGAPAGGAAAVVVPEVPAAVPVAARTSTTPETFRPQLEAFVAGHLARVKTTDAKAGASSREAIVAEVTAADASSTYKDVYAETLARQLVLMAGEGEVRQRVAAGVIAARVAEKVDNAQMQSVAVKLLEDKNWGVVLWGMKTAKGVLNYRVQLPGGLAGSPLAAAVASAAVAHAAKGDVIREATEALQVADLTRLMRLPGATQQALVPHVMKVLDARVALYKQGIPEDPGADLALVTFFSNAAFGALPAEQRLAAMQRIVDMLGLSVKAGQAASAEQQRVIGIHSVLVGRSLYVMAQQLNRPETAPGKAAVQAAEFFRTASDRIPPAPATISGAYSTLVTAIRGIPEFKSVQPVGE